jgi:ethanolamine utilization protein EutQ
VKRRVVSAEDVLALARSGATQLVVAPGDRVTPLARDVAHERGIRLVTQDESARIGPGAPPPRRSLRHVTGAATMPLPPFPYPGPPPQMDVRATDVITSADGVPLAAGVMSLREGSFPWSLDYDEIEYVLEGELHITSGDQRIVGRPGDVIAVPKGSSITFGTPSWARFLYVTYPADWGTP